MTIAEIFAIIFACIACIGFLIGTISFFVSYKRTKRDFTVDKMQVYEKLVKDFLAEHNLNSETDVKEIAARLGYSIYLTNKIPFLVDARIDDKKKCIEVQERSSYAQRKFDIAHEIAHIINNDVATAQRKEHIFGHSKSSEQIYDYMAAAILISAETFKKRLEDEYINKNKFEREEFIERFAGEKNLQQTVVARRICEVRKLYGI